MNYALIFAGGVGQRMNSTALPKQFLLVKETPIIVHTINHFQKCNLIDGIIVVCVETHIDLMRNLSKDYNLTKIIEIIPGGSNGQESIFNGLKYLKNINVMDDDIVLIHDGVRPLIDEETIRRNINCVKNKGNCVTTAKSVETVLISENDKIINTVDRSKCYLGRAPQSFYFSDIYLAHEKARQDGKLDFIDSAMLMQHYGHKLYTIDGPQSNIKITTPIDYFIFKAILEESDNDQIKIL